MRALLSLIIMCLLEQASADLPLWPLPVLSTVYSGYSNLDGSFHFKILGGSSNDVLERAFARYEQLIGVPIYSFGNINECTVSPSISDLSNIVGSDESYDISISSNGECFINGVTTWGIIRGLETFTQLLVKGKDGSVSVNGLPLSISDYPRFKHRGMMIDSARHYLPVETIRQIIDSLPLSKFNVLHWHATDAESFPLDTPSEPTMINGAYSSQAIYSMENLTYLTSYAYDRGVELLIEIDMPGHAYSWNQGKPGIVADCSWNERINSYALNPSLSMTYTTINHILQDTITATAHTTGVAVAQSRLHLGGDEIEYDCWTSDSSVVSYAAEHNVTLQQLFCEFLATTDAMVYVLNASVVHWSDAFLQDCNGFRADTVFQVWQEDIAQEVISEITAANYSVIVSSADYWYVSEDKSWQDMYLYEPTTDIPYNQQNLIIGGEVVLFGEYADEDNIMSMLYPRACAVGERLWSPITVSDTTNAEKRLEIQRCRLKSRGFPSAPLNPGYCTVSYI